MAPAIGLPPPAASLAVTLAQLGYAAGLLLLVPLGDRVENRRLITLTILASIPALLATGFAHSTGVFLAAALFVGLTACAVQMLVPFAAHLAPEAVRGRVVGTMVSGLLVGILLSRPLASIVTSVFGWRAIFIISAAAMPALALVLSRKLPRRQPHATIAMVTCSRRWCACPSPRHRCTAVPPIRQPVLPRSPCSGLRRRCCWLARTASRSAASPCSRWSPLPVPPPHPWPGLADREHGRAGTAVALLLVAGGFALAFWGGVAHFWPLLALAGVVLDCGVQANLVFSQRVIYGMAPEMRSRLNGVFMAAFFLGGAAGSAVKSLVLARWGWSGICVLGVGLPVLALVYFGFGERAASTARQR